MSTLKDKTELSGLLGESISVRKVKGRVVLKNRPVLKASAPTAKQDAVTEKFTEAAQWATAQMLKPDVKALYAARLTDKVRAPFTLAVGDYLKAPKVGFIDVSTYKGAVGDIIASKATDDFLVTQVKVIITDGAGRLIEQGTAVQDADKAFIWNYVATVANAALPGTKISVTAFDRPGNRGTLEQVL